MLGQNAIYCDVGLRISIENLPQQLAPHPLSFELCVPFVAEQDELVDVVPILRDDSQIANLVFGNDAALRNEDAGTFYNDEEKDVLFTRLSSDSSKRVNTDKRIGFSLWLIQSDGPVSNGDVRYMRFRFRVRRAGRSWSWQNGPRRKSHAISDLRVNELRERPELEDSPDYGLMCDVAEANVFIATPSSLRVGRVSPEPSHVRILEGRGWEKYMRRRIGDQSSVLVVTHWKLSGVTKIHPFRALIEVERRSPTPIRAALIAVVLSLAGFLALSPLTTVSNSALATILSYIAVWLTGLGIGAALVAYRLLVPFILNQGYKRIRLVFRALERWRYRLPR